MPVAIAIRSLIGQLDQPIPYPAQASATGPPSLGGYPHDDISARLLLR